MSYCRGALYVVNSGTSGGTDVWLCYTCTPAFEVKDRLSMAAHLSGYHMWQARTKQHGSESQEIFESAAYATFRLLREEIEEMQRHGHIIPGD